MSIIAEKARDLAVHCEVKLHALRKTQDGNVVSFVVSPLEMPSQLALDPLGTRYIIAIVPIDDQELPISRTPASPPLGSHQSGEDPPANIPAGGELHAKSLAAKERYAQAGPMKQACQRAGILAQDPDFQKWVSEIHGCDVSELAAKKFIHLSCGVDTRADIATRLSAYSAFCAIENHFKMRGGRMAEARG